MAELDLQDERRERPPPITWADVDAWLAEQRNRDLALASMPVTPIVEPLRIPPRQPLVWREMTDAEKKLIQSLRRCRLAPASFEKRFMESLSRQAGAERPLITEKQSAALTRLGNRHRTQLSKVAPDLPQLAPIRIGAAVVSSCRNLPRMVIDAYVLLPGTHVFIGTSHPVSVAPWFEIFGEPVSANLNQRKAMTRFFHNPVVTERVEVKGRFLRRPMVWRVCRARLDKIRTSAARSLLEGRWTLPEELVSTLIVACDRVLEQQGVIPLPGGVQTPSVLPRLLRERAKRADRDALSEEFRAGIPFEASEVHRENARVVQPEVRHG